MIYSIYKKETTFSTWKLDYNIENLGFSFSYLKLETQQINNKYMFCVFSIYFSLESAPFLQYLPVYL